MAKRQRKSLTQNLEEVKNVMKGFNLQEHMTKMKEDKEKAEARERKAVQEEYFRKAAKAGFNRKQAKFLQEEFSDLGHEHWDGRVGGVEY